MAEALAAVRERGDPAQLALCLDRVATWAIHTGQWQTAADHCREAIDLCRRHQLPHQEAMLRATLGGALLMGGRREDAVAETETGRALLLDHPDPASLGVVEYVRGEALQALGRPRAALRAYRSSGDVAVSLGNSYGRAVIFHRIGDLLHGLGRTPSARLCWLHAHKWYEHLGSPEATDMAERLG